LWFHIGRGAVLDTILLHDSSLSMDRGLIFRKRPWVRHPDREGCNAFLHDSETLIRSKRGFVKPFAF